MKKIIVSARTKEYRIAIIEDGQLQDIFIERPTDSEEVGQIYKGRIEKVIPGLQAAFVELGLAKNGFLQRDQLVDWKQDENLSISNIIHQGEYKLVQVKKVGTDTKGPTLTDNIEITGHYVVYLPNGNYIAASKKISNNEERERLMEIGAKEKRANEGFIFRTSCKEITAEKIIEEIQFLREEWEGLLKKDTKKKPGLLYVNMKIFDRVTQGIKLQEKDEVIVDDDLAWKEIKKRISLYFPSFKNITKYNKSEDVFSSYGVEAELDKLHQPHVWLKKGASLYIEFTEAMTIVDVNTSKYTGSLNKESTILKVNENAAIEIARQIRLRNCSGIILIDFINMETHDARKKVLEVLREELKKDHQYTQIFGFTKLGFVEMTRKKQRLSMDDLLNEKCSVCNGKGKIPSSETIAYQVERAIKEFRGTDHEAIWLDVPEEVYHIMNEKVKDLEQELYISIHLTVDTHMHTYHIRHVGSKKEVLQRIKNDRKLD